MVEQTSKRIKFAFWDIAISFTSLLVGGAFNTLANSTPDDYVYAIADLAVYAFILLSLAASIQSLYNCVQALRAQ